MCQTMRLQGGKHTGQLLMATDGCPNAPGRLFVTDGSTKMQFLVDTGSELCVFPGSAVQQRRTKTTYQLSAANGTTINTYDYINLELDLPLRGADFLQFYNLMVDIRNRRLIDNTTTLYIGVRSNIIQHDIFSENTARPKHNIVHFIKTIPGPPVSCSPCRLAPDKQQIAKCEFEAMLKNGTARPDLPKAAGRHPFTSHRRRNQDGDPVAIVGC
ncbi:hypothetical protein EVAR_84048_1 [Eumeta japonica]|uniref:Peptidase A2 domain-containing protein n=1 Tax=Eumeta variegata TaxID=151549 RepID=A0A4C2A1T3_EUMVA|nr:hypothetical protein EVAR_84048_1 [Eumeta japonica]